MKLIIAEKPTLARNIAEAIGDMKKENGYFRNEQYFVTWAFGHLFTLCDIEEYNPAPEGSSGWTMANLPCFPQKYRFTLRKDDNGQVDSGVKRQFEVIKSLCTNDKVDTIINAGDSDREGEIIVRIIIDRAMNAEEKSEKSLKRLWLVDQTAETIRKQLADPHDEANYDNLAFEGYARMFIDWMYGVNLTRYATLKSGTLLRVGRVIVPIVKAIYDRDMAIESFVKEPYYAVISSVGETELTSKNKFAKDEIYKAQELCDLYNKTGAYVVSVKRKKDTVNPGKLYSLTKLQNALSKKYKMSMNDSLATLQRLYEKGYVTYPRTNSEYLATAEADNIRRLIDKVAEKGYKIKFKNSKAIFDDSKIESHSALTPTTKIPDKSKLTEDEAKVYGAIIRRFAAVFCSETCYVDRTEAIIAVGKPGEEPIESFTLKGTVMLEAGWTAYDDYSGKDKILPPMKKGEEVAIDFGPVEKETSPPKHYTIETLNNYLKNPFREELSAKNKAKNSTSDESGEQDAANDIDEYKAIFEGLELGTEATRTGIIDNARKSRYIELKKDVYHILPGGKFLIESLARMNIGMDKYKTAEVGGALKKVYRGEMKIKESLAIAMNEISQVFSAANNSPEAIESDCGFYGDEIGICPICGSKVVRGRYGYICEDREKCKFSVSLSICRKTISVSHVKQLLETGRTPKIDGFISKNNKAFSAYLKLEEGRAVFDFDNN